MDGVLDPSLPPPANNPRFWVASGHTLHICTHAWWGCQIAQSELSGTHRLWMHRDRSRLLVCWTGRLATVQHHTGLPGWSFVPSVRGWTLSCPQT